MPGVDPSSGVTECPRCAAALDRLSRRLARERTARQEAERAAESGLRDLYRAKRDLALLCQVTAQANTATSAEDIVGPAIDALLKTSGWHIGCVFELGGDDEVGPARLVTANRDDLKSLVLLMERSGLAMDLASEAGKALAAGQVYFDVNMDLLPFAQRLLAEKAGMRMSIIVPVRTRERLVAVMYFMTPSSNVETERWTALLGQIADQVARVYERQQLTAQLLHDALHDPLTGLPNRQLFTDRLNRAARNKKAGGADYSVLFLDLDRFKAVNDIFGHAAGDRLLKEASHRIAETVTGYRLLPEPTVARVGGDEFCILIEGEASPDAKIGHRIARDLVSQIARPFLLGADRAEVGVSIGVAPSFRAAGSGELILKRADTAMYGAKAKGRGQVQLYDRRFWESDMRRERLIASLRESVDTDFGGFRVVFQPIVDIATNKLKGFEALLRFTDDSGAAISPEEFIPLAEENGLINRIGQFVFDRALQAQARFNSSAQRKRRLCMSINVSPLQLTATFPAMVRETLDRYAADPTLIAVEITEGVVIDRSDTTVGALDGLRDMGINLSIDDFGSGYATFGTLKKFSFRTIKIDRSFIETLTEIDGGQIVKAIIEMGKGLGVGVIAEGIETIEQADILREFGCSSAQGFYFSHPLSFEDSLKIIDDGDDVLTSRAA